MGSTQGDLHRNTGCDEYGGKHFPFVRNLFGFPQENKVHSVALSLRRSLLVQFFKNTLIYSHSLCNAASCTWWRQVCIPSTMLKMKSRVCHKECYMLFYFQSLRSLMNVVEPAVREILRSTPASKKPASLYFVVVEGALCRLHQMGAKVILDPLNSIKDVLQTTVRASSGQT